MGDDGTRDYAALARQCHRVVSKRGHDASRAEDLVQEMLLAALEHPQGPLSLELLYRKALDVLDPRKTWQWQRHRTSARFRFTSLDAPLGPGRAATLYDRLSAPHAGLTGESLPMMQEPVRSMALLYLQGYTMREIGQMFGVSQSRVEQRFAAVRQRDVRHVG